MESVSSNIFDYVQDVNVRAPRFLIKMLVPNLSAAVKQNGQASVINLSCIKGTKASAGMMSYCMSKAALESMTKSFALDLGHLGIRVNSLSASYINTKFGNISDNATRNKVIANESFINPMKRVANVQEVIRSIVYLASPHSMKMTGQTLVVDGGLSITSRGTREWNGQGEDVRKGLEVNETYGLSYILNAQMNKMKKQ